MLKLSVNKMCYNYIELCAFFCIIILDISVFSLKNTRLAVIESSTATIEANTQRLDLSGMYH